VSHVLSSAACDASLALEVSRGAIVGIMPVSLGSAIGHCDLAVALVPAAARVLPRAAGSDDGFERTSRGRDILESWSFSFQCTPCGDLYNVLTLPSTGVNFLF
jgi:hypothetical protein